MRILQHSHTATFDKYTGSGVNMCIQQVKKTIYDVISFYSAPTSEKLPSDGSSNRTRKKQIRAETYPPAVIKHKINTRFKNGILEDNNNPVDCNQTLAIVRYADDDLMYWSKPWSCRSSGVILPVRDLNLPHKTKIDFKSRHSVLHSDSNS